MDGYKQIVNKRKRIFEHWERAVSGQRPEPETGTKQPAMKYPACGSGCSVFFLKGSSTLGRERRAAVLRFDNNGHEFLWHTFPPAFLTQAPSPFIILNKRYVILWKGHGNGRMFGILIIPRLLLHVFLCYGNQSYRNLRPVSFALWMTKQLNETGWLWCQDCYGVMIYWKIGWKRWVASQKASERYLIPCVGFFGSWQPDLVLCVCFQPDIIG